MHLKCTANFRTCFSDVSKDNGLKEKLTIKQRIHKINTQQYNENIIKKSNGDKCSGVNIKLKLS